MASLSEVDRRIELVYHEAVRGLTHQQGVVESMNSRAGSLIFASSFASSLLGSSALADGVAGWDWLAMALLLMIGGLIVFQLWPYHNTDSALIRKSCWIDMSILTRRCPRCRESLP